MAGFHTEYSGLRFSFFFFAEYAAMFIVGAIQAGLFLGGWNSPLGIVDPVYWAVGYQPVHAAIQYFNGAIPNAHGLVATAQALGLQPHGGLSPLLAMLILNVYCAAWFVIKAMGIVFVQIWLRWTLPRIRIDQVLYACVKALLPASLVTLLGTAVWIWLVPQPGAAELGPDLTIQRLGHIVNIAPPLQLITQIVLTILGVALVAACVGVVLWAFIFGRRETKRSLFTDVMPVGREIAFTKGA